LAYNTVERSFITDYACFYDTSVEILGVDYPVDDIPDNITLQDEQGCDSIDFTIEIIIEEDIMSLATEAFCENELPIITYNGGRNYYPVEVFVNGVLDTIIQEPDLSDPSTFFMPFTLEGQVGENTITTTGAYCTFSRTIDLQPISADLDIIVNELGGNNFQLEFLTTATLSNRSWFGSELLSCFTCDAPTITIEEDTEVSLTIISDGCTTTKAVWLTYNADAEESIEIYRPTAIDLNETGNDIFFLQSSNEVNITRLRIFDRWGNLVYVNDDFSTNNPGDGWDGRYNSQQAEQGVYLYQIEYNDPTQGIQEKIGSFTLIR